MIDQKYIDEVAQQIALQTEVLQQEIVRDLLKLSKDIRFKTIDEFLFAMEQLDIQQIVLAKSKNILVGYQIAHSQILTDMELFADITEETLGALTNFSTSQLYDHLGSMSGIFKKEIVKGAISGATDTTILQAIQQQAGLSNFQMQTLVRTGLNDYSASVGKVMIDQLSANERIRYVGPVDNRTRPLCLKYYEMGSIPRNRISGVELQYRGGYNCRHQWMPVKASNKNKDVRTDA